jgi:trehalose-6-phosphate synthase
VLEWIEVLREKYNGKKLVVARDKLDYVKGVRQKMLAFETFLTMHPEWQGKVVYNIYCNSRKDLLDIANLNLL